MTNQCWSAFQCPLDDWDVVVFSWSLKSLLQVRSLVLSTLNFRHLTIVLHWGNWPWGTAITSGLISNWQRLEPLEEYTCLISGTKVCLPPALNDSWLQPMNFSSKDIVSYMDLVASPALHITSFAWYTPCFNFSGQATERPIGVVALQSKVCSKDLRGVVQ